MGEMTQTIGDRIDRNGLLIALVGLALMLTYPPDAALLYALPVAAIALCAYGRVR